MSMYCTLQEAWGDSVKKPKETFANPNTANNIEKYDNYKKVNYPEADLYNPYGESIYQPKTKPKEKNYSNRFDFQRSGIEKLPDTNGPKKRVNLPPINIHLDNQNDSENSKNDDFPQSQIDENYINPQHDNGYDHGYDNENADFQHQENMHQIENMCDDTMLNKKLDSIIEQLNNKSDDFDSDTNNINDLLLYIITGIFFIFILDTFTKIGGKFNN